MRTFPAVPGSRPSAASRCLSPRRLAAPRIRTLPSRIALALFLSCATLALSVNLAGPVSRAFAEEAKETVRRRTFLDEVKAGGWIGHTIILCSIVGLSLSLAYAFQIRRDALVPPELLAQIEQLFEDEDYEEAFHVCEANPCYFSSILMAGLAKLDEGYEEMQKAMQEAGEIETTKLYQKISWISLIAAISPMLGLFGTVSGMIATFNVIASSDIQPKPAELAGGISQALVTTFEGLLVAIPMTVVYAVFRYRIANVVLEVGGILEELTSRFKQPSASA